jgi:uncharacterized protein YecE (DUF72 family)
MVAMRFRIGTSGFSYAPWRGSFYPADLADDAMLRFYAARFDAVEINNTFYRMPTPRSLEGWAGDVPDGFAFALKAPRYVVPKWTPSERGDPIVAFFERTAVLGTKLGPTLVTIPPFYKEKDAALLAGFLERFPRERRLRARNVALCITDADELSVPPLRTAPFLYVRLRRTAYGRADLEAWAKRLSDLGAEEAWVFFKHEDEGTGPRLASELRAVVG